MLECALSRGSLPVFIDAFSPSSLRDKTKDIIANPRELNQAVTFLHENGKAVFNCACASVCVLVVVVASWGGQGPLTFIERVERVAA
jgi:hypothetical protein